MNISVYLHKGLDVETFNILGEYLRTEIYEYAIMFIVGSLAKLVLKVTPKIHQKMLS